MSMNPSTTVIDTAASPPRHPHSSTLENSYLQELWKPIAKLDPRLPRQWDFKPQHQKYLADRGIGQESACYAGIFSASGDLAQMLIGRPDSCLIFSYFEPYGRKLYTWKHPETGEVLPFYRARLDMPDGKQRFASPPKSRVFPYWPRVKGFSWLDTPSMGRQIPSSLKGKDMLLTEGEPKALCGTINEFPTVGLGGIWGWLKSGREGGDDELLEELYDFDWNLPRQIIGVFDSDASHNPLVVQAMRRFGKCLIKEWDERKSQDAKMPQYYFAQQLNKKLKFILLPTTLDEEKMGLDDFLVKFNSAGLKLLVDKALTFQSVKVEKSELKITPYYTGELLGPYTPAKGGLDKVRATHYRGLLTYFTLAWDIRYTVKYGGMRYDPDKGVWEPLDREAFDDLIETVCRVNNWENRKSDLKTANFKLAKEMLLVHHTVFDSPRYLGFKNGVKVQNGDGSYFFKAHSRDHFITKRLGFDFDEMATCPTFEWLLGEQYGNGSTTAWALLSLFRWTLEPKAKDVKYGFDVFPILLGPPGSGKGTILWVLQALLGFNEGCATFSLKSLSVHEPEKKLGLLENKFAAIDLDYKGHLDEATLSLLNKIVSNEPVVINSKYVKVYSATLNTVVWAAANKMPTVSNGDGEGFSRRALVIKVRPRQGKADPELRQRLEGELAGIYNLVTKISKEAAQRNIENFRSSKVNLDTRREWVINNNTAIAWMAEWLEGAKEEELEGYLRDYYQDYLNWCGEEGHKSPLKKRSFSTYLTNAGGEKTKRHGDKGWLFKLPKKEEIQWEAIK